MPCLKCSSQCGQLSVPNQESSHSSAEHREDSAQARGQRLLGGSQGSRRQKATLLEVAMNSSGRPKWGMESLCSWPLSSLGCHSRHPQMLLLPTGRAAQGEQGPGAGAKGSMKAMSAKELLLLATGEHLDHIITFPTPGCLPENFPM